MSGATIFPFTPDPIVIYFSPGAPKDKRVVILVDDLNMPKLEQYGAQPPIELLRQFQDFRGFYDREKLFWKEVQVRQISLVSCH